MKKNELAIGIKGVHKRFRVYTDKGSTLKERILFFKSRGKHSYSHVLRGVDVEIPRGQAVGLIGENGSGKSTLLKLLTRIMMPDEGEIQMNGRVSSLLELGAGFHPDMSGRENIYTNASIFGLSRKEIDARLKGIIKFAELGDAIDMPVRTYSSGMYMRLAFAVAINVDADILLVDEILAVGDANFQRKCFNRLRDVKKKGTTIVIVSHSLSQIEQFCDRSVWLKDGVICADGNPRTVHAQYLDFMDKRVRDEQRAEQEQDKLERGQEGESKQAEEVSAETPEADAQQAQEPEPEEEPKRFGNKDIEFTEIDILDEHGESSRVLETGKPMTIVMKYRKNSPAPSNELPINVGVGIFRNDGVQCYGTNTSIDFGAPVKLARDQDEIAYKIAENLLLNGEYFVDVAVVDMNGFAYDYFKDALRFQSVSALLDVGTIRMHHEWSVGGQPITKGEMK